MRAAEVSQKQYGVAARRASLLVQGGLLEQLVQDGLVLRRSH